MNLSITGTICARRNVRNRRTAMELKMDSYRALNMFVLEAEAEVRAAGHAIMDPVQGLLPLGH